MKKAREIHGSKRLLFIMATIVVYGVMMTSCNAIKKFLNTRLDDEDYIVGQLYADEYVTEPAANPTRRQDNAGVAGSKTGIELNEKDNPKLYEAIDSWIGTPYLYGGCSTDGIDCSCFVGKIYKSVYGVNLHRVSNDIQQDVTPVKRDELREGDILFFTNSNGRVSHVGIYLKDDMFVHSSTSRGVSVSSLNNSYWQKHFYKGGRHKSVTTKYK